MKRARGRRPADCPYVTKGGLKLEFALRHFGVPVQGGAAADLGCHGGGFTGINANLDMFIDKGYISVVMTNYDGAGSPVDSKIAELLGRVE